MDVGSKSDLYELLIRILVEKSSSTVLLINALCGGSTVKLGDSDGRPPGGTFPPAKSPTLETDNRGQVVIARL